MAYHYEYYYIRSTCAVGFRDFRNVYQCHSRLRDHRWSNGKRIKKIEQTMFLCLAHAPLGPLQNSSPTLEDVNFCSPLEISLNFVGALSKSVSFKIHTEIQLDLKINDRILFQLS